MQVDKFEQMLTEAGYDRDEMQYLVTGFRHGFDLEYEGPTERSDSSRNIPFTVGNKTELWNKIMNEVSLGRHAGPFEHVPFHNYVQSIIGLVDFSPVM